MGWLLCTSEMVSAKGRSITRCYNYHTDNADYILIVSAPDKSDAYTKVLAYLKETNEFISCVDFNRGMGVISFSVHLVKRFAERFLHYTELPLTSVWKELAKYEASVKIYEKDDNFVRATGCGLFFGTGDRKRNLLINKTYVSLDMMHDIQQSAWDKVTGLLSSMEELNKFFGPRDFHVNYEQLLPDSLHLTKKEAISIYNQYAELNIRPNRKS